MLKIIPEEAPSADIINPGTPFSFQAARFEPFSFFNPRHAFFGTPAVLHGLWGLLFTQVQIIWRGLRTDLHIFYLGAFVREAYQHFYEGA